MTMVEITKDNYFSEEVNRKYLSSHNFMDYLKDPVLFYMKNNGYFERRETNALVAGTLFHAFVDNEQEFREIIDNYQPVIFNTRSKTINKDKSALDFIDNGEIEKLVVKADFRDVWQFILSNWDVREAIWKVSPYEEREAILKGEIAGVPFKGRADRLIFNKSRTRVTIYDYKTIGLKEFYGRYYHEEMERWVEKTFLQEYGYDLQMYVYKRLVNQMYDIPMDKIDIRMGLLVKSGSTAFIQYQSNFVETEFIQDEDLLAPRLFGGMTVADIIDHKAKDAYELVNQDELPEELAKESILYNLYADKKKRQPIPINNIRI